MVERKYLVWDFTCNDTLASTYVTKTSVVAGGLADKFEETKLEHYEDLMSTHIVTPMAVETMGSWGQMGLGFIKELGARITNVTKDNRSTSYLFQALSMAIQRGNAISVMGTVPDVKELDEIYHLVGQMGD